MKLPQPSQRDLVLFRGKIAVQSQPSRPDIGPCWEWTASCTRDGYGQFARAGRRMAAHQLAFEWLGGSAIPRGLFVLHLCDNRRCCRPDHLYAGTQQRNVRDTYERGRMPLERIGSRGERNGSARLTESAVAEMRRLYAHEGCTQASLAKAFGCSAATVHYVVRGTYWKAVAA